jgi:hypothetical protein
MGNQGTVQETEFVFRRLSDALHFGGRDYSPYLWLAILVPVLILALAYAGWMYARDARSVGRGWATLLGALRCTVYLLLAGVFLLPALQSWDISETRSKVLVLLDVSGSMATLDDLPSQAVPVEKLLMRRDKVLRFLTDQQVAFLRRLQEKNPVSMYRLGAVLDEEPRTPPADGPLPAAEWVQWLAPNPNREVPADLSDDEKAKFRKQQDLEALLVNGTNLPDALLTALNRESNNMLQGIVLFSDGRSTQITPQAVGDLQARADRAKVPIFTVAVGERRQHVRIQITDVQAPDQARPDDRFPVRVEVDGEGLAGKDANVALDVTKPNGEKVTLKPSLRPGESPTFRPGEPPHLQAEFDIDKPGIEGEWKIFARVPKDPREVFVPKEHVSDPVTVNVVKRPVRVLLFAGGPTHDYQFARTLFIREMDKGRADVSIYLQSARPDVVQDVAPERMLRHFPSVLGAADDPKATAEEKFNNLAHYDLIIAFDPDWTQVSPEQMALLERWVGTHAGGLVMVAGPVNTFQLARGVNYEKLKPALDLCPIVPEDSRLQGLGVERPTTDPFRLNFVGAGGDLDFLKLEEENKDVMAGWEAFFGQKEGGTVQRGFYSYYPAKAVKPNATVVATFADPRARTSDGKEQPYLVVMPYGSGKVVYIADGEVWRLRQYREVYFERFWTKLARYAGSGNLTRGNKRVLITMGRNFTANHLVPIQAQLFGQDMKPVPASEKPKAQIAPVGGGQATVVEMGARSRGGEHAGWFEGRFLPRSAGAYELRLQAPGTTDIETHRFIVKESNPELDNTQPDFAELAQLSSDAAQVLSRVSDDVKAELKAELERTNQPSAAHAGEGKETARLFFDLKSAPLIPKCMVTERKTVKSRGPIQDLWDAGVVLGDADPPRKISAVLLIVVGLLSVEWLTRKLLKLA